eukprot:TRINITY_DN29211_c0_g1_i1.p1 TRINITY_DN29211_c0_g1~~TRINITY_DN29211_c0_g1_i1.p1  ORF type:complete len:692 (-),score=104.50 TRINITY_DN29211_c0_g1_i1:381-2456(-)
MRGNQLMALHSSVIGAPPGIRRAQVSKRWVVDDDGNACKALASYELHSAVSLPSLESLPIIADGQSSREVSQSVYSSTRAGDFKLGRPGSHRLLEANIFRDAVLLQGQVSGCVPQNWLPRTKSQLKAQLAPARMRNLDTGLSAVGSRLGSQLLRSERWQRLQDAREAGDIDALRTAIKSAQIDVELGSMPIVTDSVKDVAAATRASRQCQEALQRTGDPSIQAKILRQAVREAEKIPLGAGLWKDPWLGRAREKLARLHETRPQCDRHAMLKTAMDTGNMEEVEDALCASRLAGLHEGELEEASMWLAEARADARLAPLQSPYFTEKANAGFASGNLFRQRCFHGEGRRVHALVFNIAKTEWPVIPQALAPLGIKICVHDVGRQQKMPDLRAILHKPSRSVLWIISGDGHAKDGALSPLEPRHVKSIVKFHRRGGGLLLSGGGGVWNYEVNLLMAALQLGRMEEDPGTAARRRRRLLRNGRGSPFSRLAQVEQLNPSHGPRRPGLNGQHPVLQGISRLSVGGDEEPGRACLPDGLLSVDRGWTELLRDKRGRLVVALLEPSSNGSSGGLAVHGAMGQLYENGDAVCRDFLQQLVGFLLLQLRDVTGRAYQEPAVTPGEVDVEHSDEDESSNSDVETLELTSRGFSSRNISEAQTWAWKPSVASWYGGRVAACLAAHRNRPTLPQLCLQQHI